MPTFRSRRCRDLRINIEIDIFYECAMFVFEQMGYRISSYSFCGNYSFLALAFCSGVFRTGAVGALAPTILGQSITVSTRNSKVLNTPLFCTVTFDLVHKCAETIQGRKLYDEIRYLVSYRKNVLTKVLTLKCAKISLRVINSSNFQKAFFTIAYIYSLT